MSSPSRQFLAGRAQEIAASREGRSAESLELREFVDVHALHGTPRPVIVAAIALVYTRTWRFRDRARLAFAVLRGFRP